MAKPANWCYDEIKGGAAMVNPYQQYKENAILTASPEELVLMLYNGIVRFIEEAKGAIEKKITWQLITAYRGHKTLLQSLCLPWI